MLGSTFRLGRNGYGKRIFFALYFIVVPLRVVLVVILLVVLLLLFVHSLIGKIVTSLWWPLRRPTGPDRIHFEQDQARMATEIHASMP